VLVSPGGVVGIVGSAGTWVRTRLAGGQQARPVEATPPPSPVTASERGAR
jgi:branched-chain amino acid transport system permease protein